VTGSSDPEIDCFQRAGEVQPMILLSLAHHQSDLKALKPPTPTPLCRRASQAVQRKYGDQLVAPERGKATLAL
jgi:hypothetical protein